MIVDVSRSENKGCSHRADVCWETLREKAGSVVWSYSPDFAADWKETDPPFKPPSFCFMSHCNVKLPPLRTDTTLGLARLPPDGRHCGGTAMSPLSPLALPPTSPVPAITGHDLMAMFPPKSPQTVRAVGGAASCTVFAQQERAFLSSAPPVRTFSRHDPGTADRVDSLRTATHSTPQSSPASPTVATLSGDKLLDGKDDREVTANNDRRIAACGHSSQKGRTSLKDSGTRRSRSRACSDATRSQALPVADGLAAGVKSSLTAIHARRLDKETGLTFIETNYRKGNEAPFVFVNQVI